MKLAGNLRLLLLLAFAFLPTEAQFGEIASLVSGLIGSGALSGLGNLGGLAGLAGTAGSAGASGAAGALSSAGTLYQLAQTALQLTGTGVGIINQASEGAWFPAVVEQAAKNQKEFQEKLLAANTNPSAIPLTSQGFFPQPGAQTAKGGKELKVGPEFGTDFTETDGYDDEDEEEKPATTTTTGVPEGTDVDEKPSKLFPEEKEVETTTSTSTKTITTMISTTTTLEVEEKVTPRRRIRVEIPEKKKNEDDSDYYDSFNTDSKTNTDFVFSEHIDEDEDPLVPPKASNVDHASSSVAPTTTKKSKTRKAPDLSRLVEILKESNLEESEINEIIGQVEGNKNLKPRENWPSTTTPNPEDLDPQDAEREQKRQKILEAHRRGIASATRLPFRQLSTTFAPPLKHHKVTNIPRKNVSIVPRFVTPRSGAKRFNTTTIFVERGGIPKKVGSLPDLRAKAFSVQSQVNPKIHATNHELKPIHERFLVDSDRKNVPMQMAARPQQVVRPQQTVYPQRTVLQPSTLFPNQPAVVYPTVTTPTPFYYHQQNLGFYQQFPQQPQLFYNMFSYPNAFQPSVAPAQNSFVFTSQPVVAPQATPMQFNVPAFPQTG
ncbi:hypothetical protein L596_020029 [Steinernema carpocapsae]|uniref:SXP/RAL-2 family protein Ani s 5-like cation-binding domain-containing protein n=1 Tax=Steinernema carpocapsae TaxID=34508 RepID=A0A4U5MSE2_STECR|nr:hypothetical protein L596_020029 [Steinernema carpocapsae]